MTFITPLLIANYSLLISWGLCPTWQYPRTVCHPEQREGSRGLHYHPPSQRPWDPETKGTKEMMLSALIATSLGLSVSRSLGLSVTWSLNLIGFCFRFPRRFAPRNDVVSVCVIARLGTSRGNLLAELCHHEHSNRTQLHFYNHNSEICGYSKASAHKKNWNKICVITKLYLLLWCTI